MITEDVVMETVWSGSHIGVYLSALNGVPPFVVRDVSTPQPSVQITRTGTLIMRQLTIRGPMTQTQLASACNRASGETRRALTRLAKRGRVTLEQPCLIAIAPHSGQRWRVK